MEEKWIILIVVALFIIFLIIYVIILYETWKKETFVFAPYEAPDPPSNAFKPQGKLTPLTADQIARNQKYLECLEKNGVKNFDKMCSNAGDEIPEDSEEILVS